MKYPFNRIGSACTTSPKEASDPARGPWVVLVMLLGGLLAINLLGGCGDGRSAPRLASSEGVDPFVYETITRTADAVEKVPRNPRGWAQLGELYYAHDYLESALNCLDVAVELAPEDPKIRYMRAVVRKRLGDESGALEDVEAAMSHDDSTPHLRWRAALWYRDAGDIDRAERLATDAMKLSNGDRNSRRILALVAMEMGRPDEAVALLRPIVKARPDDRETRSTLVRAFRLSNDMDSAEREAILAGDIRPNYFDPWINDAITRRTDLPFWIRRAQRSANQGDTESARRIMDTVLKKWYPDARDVGFTEGVILVSEGRHGEAADLFVALVEEHPDWSQAMTRAAAATLAASPGAPEADRKAGALVERSLEIEPENIAGKMMLAGIYERSGDNEAALGRLEEVVAAQPWMPEPRLMLARLQREGGDPSACLVTLDGALKIFGPGMGIDLLRASALLDLGRYDEAAVAIAQLKSKARRPMEEIRLLERRLEEVSAP